MRLLPLLLSLVLAPACDCRSLQSAQTDAGADSGPEDGAHDADTGDGDGDGDDGETLPFVMFILDSSGSMELLFDCTCETHACNECMPDCAAGEGSRWMGVIEAMTGTYLDGNCTRIERTAANGATFDVGYYREHARPPVESSQADDGILDNYGDLVEFGIATYDPLDTYQRKGPLVPASDDFDYGQSAGVEGCWSYGSGDTGPRTRPDGSVAGSFFYPNCPEAFQMDTGIRNASADNGALSVTLGGEGGGQTLAQLAAVIVGTRPWGGTPTAAALDDMDAYLSDDPQVSAYLERPGARVHIVLLTDGKPDDDYRKFACDCTQNDDAQAPGFCGMWSPMDGPIPMQIDPEVMHCSYPLAEDAAHTLRCGWGDGDKCGDGPVEAIHVIAIDSTEAPTKAPLLAIALAGGTDAPRNVQSTAELRKAIADILDAIVAGR